MRLMTKVARMYHEQGVRQPQIAAQLNVSQARVSRLLKQAAELGIVRTIVIGPPGVHSDLELSIEQRFGLRDVVVADTAEQEDEYALLPALGAAAAVYLETTLARGERIGISSWSSTLLATVDALRPRPSQAAELVVQMLGGLGTVTAQSHATRLTGRLAELTGAQAVFLPAPGLVASATTVRALVRDTSIASVLAMYRDLSMILVGVGSLVPSPLLQQSGNAIEDVDQQSLRELGAVGDICLRFFNEAGTPVRSPLNERVVGIDASSLRAVPRRVAVAGGARKFTAIRAALVAGWVNVLVTDQATAQRLCTEPAGL
ncbi:sugar-binding transcriptional regulator [Acidothermaceae bacterium B102]|nr:sugar-binding transcriptional regulator [Acidothermaceae bacterium B102]